MEIKTLQDYLKHSAAEMEKPFGSGAEVMMTIIEELGEVSQEISLIEQIGSKVEWEINPSQERLAEEMTHLLKSFLC